MDEIRAYYYWNRAGAMYAMLQQTGEPARHLSKEEYSTTGSAAQPGGSDFRENKSGFCLKILSMGGETDMPGPGGGRMGGGGHGGGHGPGGMGGGPGGMRGGHHPHHPPPPRYGWGWGWGFRRFGCLPGCFTLLLGSGGIIALLIAGLIAIF